MILTIPTKYAAGIAIWGDYWDLHSLHGTIHELVENAQFFNEGIKETILGLAYDIRHAYQRDREEESFGHDEYDKITYRGVQILWPMVLFQVNALRLFASFQPTTKDQQANLYRLEDCLEKSLYEVDRKIGAECVEWLNMPSPLTRDYYCLYLTEASKKYIEGGIGKARFRKLPSILRNFHPMTPAYKDFAVSLEATAKEQGCSPHELHDPSEGPEIKW
jgi:hypothetical protein